MPKALVFGSCGQDGSYLIELLLEKGYEVAGVKRRASSLNTQRIDHLFDHPRLTLHYGDMTDSANILDLLAKIRPDEVYGLAAQSHVQVSFDQPEYTANADAIGTLRILEGIRLLGLKSRYYQASTSELFGQAPSPQNEQTPMIPVSPYGVAKLFAFHTVTAYRKAYGLFACNGILFNHESPRRGETFVTRKITRGLAAIKSGRQKELVLGNLEARRDWTHAKDCVRAMWMMLQAPEPRDYVVASGQQYSVREFVNHAGDLMGMRIKWKGDEGYWCGERIIRCDAKYLRPAEVPDLMGDASKVRAELGWKPEISFHELVAEMVAHDSGVAA